MEERKLGHTPKSTIKEHNRLKKAATDFVT